LLFSKESYFRLRQVLNSVDRDPQNIFLIDDDEPMRNSISKMLNIYGYRVNAYSSPAKFLSSPILESQSVVITDMVFPGLSGLDIQLELQNKGLNLPIIFISGDSSVSQSIKAMKQGAVDFLVKPFDSADLISAVDQAFELLACETKKIALREALKVLSPRERETFGLLALGFNNQEIQDKLNISLPTAKQYKSEVMRKLNFDSFSQLLEFKNKMNSSM